MLIYIKATAQQYLRVAASSRTEDVTALVGSARRRETNVSSTSTQKDGVCCTKYVNMCNTIQPALHVACCMHVVNGRCMYVDGKILLPGNHSNSPAKRDLVEPTRKRRKGVTRRLPVPIVGQHYPGKNEGYF